MIYNLITESWANNDLTDTELGGGVLLYIKDTIPAYEVQLQEEADCNEAMSCKLVTGIQHLSLE